jgi:hypothetical protein
MYDIIFINDSANQYNSDFDRLKQSWPFAKAASSFKEAQQKSITRLFWAVWPDVVVDRNFNFDYRPPVYEEQYIHIWPNSVDRDLPAVGLFPKDKEIAAEELTNRYFSGMVKMNTIASHTKYPDIVFISFNEETADDNYKKLVNHPGIFYNAILRINGVKGIHQAHIAAAKIATTSMFYVVDADAIIDDDFKFNFLPSADELDIVHVWRSRNPINGLEYGNGGVKLLPRELTLNVNTSATDMTTSISSRFKIMTIVSNITAFNTSPLATWRSAFRECAKLSSRIIDGQLDEETEDRLKVWQYNLSNAAYAEYARGGASAGNWFGTTYKDDPEMLAKINDYDWLAAEFDQHVKMFPPEMFK